MKTCAFCDLIRSGEFFYEIRALSISLTQQIMNKIQNHRAFHNRITTNVKYRFLMKQIQLSAMIQHGVCMKFNLFDVRRFKGRQFFNSSHIDTETRTLAQTSWVMARTTNLPFPNSNEVVLLDSATFETPIGRASG
jgi:hypothetical protein